MSIDYIDLQFCIFQVWLRDFLLKSRKYFLPLFYKMLFYKHFPSKYLIENLRVSYIFNHEGLIEASTRPHSHLWDKIDWVDIDLTFEQKRMYIQSSKMTWKHWVDYYNYPTEVKFHEHGLPDHGVEDEIANIYYWYAQYNKKKLKILLALLLWDIWFLILIG